MPPELQSACQRANGAAMGQNGAMAGGWRYPGYGEVERGLPKFVLLPIAPFRARLLRWTTG
jgi:hypothetical protein